MRYRLPKREAWWVSGITSVGVVDLADCSEGDGVYAGRTDRRGVKHAVDSETVRMQHDQLEAEQHSLQAARACSCSSLRGACVS